MEALESLPICSSYTIIETLGKSKPYYKNCGAHNEKSPFWAQSDKAGGNSRFTLAVKLKQNSLVETSDMVYIIGIIGYVLPIELHRQLANLFIIGYELSSEQHRQLVSSLCSLDGNNTYPMKDSSILTYLSFSIHF